MQKNNKVSVADNTKSETSLKNTIAAHKEADKDMEKDPDLNDKPKPGDDLDEGELARFEGEE